MDSDELARYANKNHIPFATPAELVSRPEIRSLIQEEVDQVNPGLNHWEQVKYFQMLERPFSEETGELTPTLKVKRKVVTEKFRALIDSMYQT
jgi:long-chain acyl-CoA synthetase